MNTERTDRLKELIKLAESNSVNHEIILKELNEAPIPHKTKEWKDRRELLIKEYCELCGKKDAILVIQHTKHPDKFQEIKSSMIIEELNNMPEIYDKYKNIAINNYINNYLNKYFDWKNTCPECNTMKIKSRSFKKPKYKCLECKIEFETAKQIEYYNGIGLRVLGREKAKVILENRINMNDSIEIVANYYYFNVINDRIDKEAIIENLKQSIEYMEMKNTITACKGCAYKQDRDKIGRKTVHNSGFAQRGH